MKLDFINFSGVIGFENIRDDKNNNEGYKTITDWIKGEIVPYITTTPLHGKNTKNKKLFQSLGIDSRNFFGIRWKDKPIDVKYKYLYELYDDSNDINWQWPKK